VTNDFVTTQAYKLRYGSVMAIITHSRCAIVSFGHAFGTNIHSDPDSKVTKNICFLYVSRTFDGYNYVAPNSLTKTNG